jgi:hypothetical protein
MDVVKFLQQRLRSQQDAGLVPISERAHNSQHHECVYMSAPPGTPSATSRRDTHYRNITGGTGRPRPSRPDSHLTSTPEQLARCAHRDQEPWRR